MMRCKFREYNLVWAFFSVTLPVLLYATETDATAEQSLRSDAKPGIVAAASEISDFEARLLLARLLSYDDRRFSEAAAHYRLLIAERPDDPRLRLEFAQVLIRQKAYPAAIVQLKRVLQHRPGDFQATVALARVYLWTGRSAEAIQLIEGLQAKQQLAVDLLLDLARAYTRDRQYDKAADTYQKALERLDRPDAQIYSELGDVYLYSDSLVQAITYFRKAFELDPSDFSIQKKLGLALSWSGENGAALAILKPLHRQESLDREVGLELARVYAKLGQLDEAVAAVESLLAQYPDDPDLLMELADLQAARGRIKTTQQLYEKALQLSGQTDEIERRYAAQMVTWGDFYRAEDLYRQYLAAHPSDAEVRLKLAGVLASAQRYEEAEGIYRSLLHQGIETQPATLGLARLYLQRKDFAAALNNVEKYLKLVQSSASDRPEAPTRAVKEAEGLQFEGDLLYRMGRYQDALQSYSGLQQITSGEAAGLLGRGKTLLAIGEPKQAAALLAQAERLAPEVIEIRYYLAAASGQDLTSEGFVNDLLKSDEYSVRELLNWGRLYAEHGAYPQAIQIYEAALAKDPQNFYARFNLAETLAINHQYDKALDQLQALKRKYPEVSKISLTYARVLGWARHYDQSIAVYDEMHQLEPDDPLPVRESARTAIWGKRMAQGQQLYQTLWQPAVDEKLLQALLPIREQTNDPSLKRMVEELEESRKQNSIYQGYEAYVVHLSRISDRITPDLKTRLQQVSIDLLPAYQLQKAGYLEGRSKWQAWNRRFAGSADSYRELIGFEPGNQEAIFDYAQVLCAVGLCDEEAKAYEQLLEVDPLHNRAALALERQRIRSHPAVSTGYSYWEERGYGDLSQIKRHQTDVAADIPLRCRYHLQFIAHHWLEEPIGYSDSFQSYGHTVSFNGVLNAYLSGAAAWTRHYYEDSELEDQNTGFARLALNIKDHAKLELGYDRSNQYVNEFAVLQGVQADGWWLSLSSYVTRNLELRVGARYLSYTDDNEAQIYSLGAGYAFTDHPRILKLNLLGEYRDTRETNVFHYLGSDLVDITHPYWAPQNYLAGVVGLEWYHDLSKFFFCGSELHYYDIRLSTGTASDDNPLVAVEAEWHYEFADHWTVQLKGLLHRSQQWDANGFWGTLQYRF